MVDNNDLNNMDDAKDTYSSFAYSAFSYPVAYVPFSVNVSLCYPSVRSYMHFLFQLRTWHTSPIYPHNDSIDLLF